MKSILHNITRACLYTLPFIPLVVASPLFFPFITGKNFLFRFLVAIALVSWTVLMLRYSEFRPKKSFILWSFVAFVVLIGISDILAINSVKAFWSNFERMEGYVTVLHLIALFIVASSTFKGVKEWKRFFNVSFIVAILVGFYSLFQLGGLVTINQGGVRIDATLGNAVYLATYMLFHVCIAAFLFLRARTENNKYLEWTYGLCALFFVFILIQTATRGTFLGLVAGAGLVTLLVAISEKKDKTLRKISIGLIIAGAVLALGFVAIKNTSFVTKSPILSRFASISASDATAKSRFMVWGMAWEGLKEKPIFGWGQENFVYVFNKHYDPGMYAQEQWFDRTHNVFFDWAISGGFLGLTSYLILFGSIIWLLWKTEGLSVAEKAVFTGLLAGYFVNNLFVFDNITSYLLFVFIAAFVHSLSAKPIKKISAVETEVSDMTTMRLALPGAIIGGILIVYFTVIQGISASLDLIDALRYVGGYTADGKPDIQKAIDSYKAALSHGPLGRSEIRERIVESAGSVNSSSVDITLKQAFFELGKVETANELARVKDDARFEFFTSIFYANYALFDDSLVHAKKALDLSPTKQSLLTHVGNLLLKKGNVQEALPLFKKAYEEKTENEEALKSYAIAAIYANDGKLLQELLVPKYGTVLIPDEKFIAAYSDTGHFDVAAKLWEMKIKDSPGDYRYYFELASAYNELGRRAEAIQMLKKIIDIEPKFKDQVDQAVRAVESGQKLK